MRRRSFAVARAVRSSSSVRPAGRRLLLPGLVFALLVLAPRGVCLAQSADTPSTPPVGSRFQPEPGLIQSRLEAAQSNPALDDSARTQLVSLYTQVLEKLREAEQWRVAATEYENAREATPAVLESIRQEADQLEEISAPDPMAYPSLALLESRLIELETQLAREQEELVSLEGEFQRRTDRRIAVPGMRAAARQRLTEIERQLALAEAAGDASEEGMARVSLLLASKRSVEAEIEAYDHETRSYEARGELLPARRDLAALRVARTERGVRAFRDAVNERRRADAEAATRQARQEAARVHPVAGEIAIENEGLAQQRSGSGGLAAKIERVSHELQETEAVLVRVTSEFESVTNKVEAIGRTDAIGYLLRSKRAELPTIRLYQRRNKERQPEIRAVQLRQIQLAEERSSLADGMESRIQQILGGLGTGVPLRRKTEVELTLRSLLRSQLGLLESLMRDYDRYFTQLIDIDAKEKALIDTTREFQAYIDEHILWVPSGETFGRTSLRDAGSAMIWLIHPQQWKAALAGIRGAGAGQLRLLIPSLLLLVLLFALRRSLWGRLRAEGQAANKGSTQTILPTVRAAIFTLLLTFMRPAAVGWLAWLLSSSTSAPAFTGYVAAGLGALALVDLLIELLRTVASPQGLGEGHFAWPSRAMKRVRATLRWSSWVGLPLVFLYAGLQAQPDAAWRESLGRLALVGIVVVLAVATHQLIQPRQGVFAEFLRTDPQSWSSRFQRIWHPVLVGTPLVLAVIALGGYTYTAYHLAQRLYGTAWLFILLLLLHAGGQRWLLMARRRLLVEQTRKRREAAAAEKRAQQEDGAAASESPAPQIEPDLDFASLDSQARQMLRLVLGFALAIGLWWVWVDIVPALTILRRVELWHTTAPVSQVALTPAGEAVAAAPGGESVIAVTLADLALSLVFLVLTIAAVRNLPGILEISLLQRLQLERSIRFAITALSRYILMIVGTIVVFGSLGIGWNKVQWLVAAMTVGLGFGLQEIFANFVSGLIILFERPMRIGDIVTVGGTTGHVSQIRMRATTITDFERRELVVPNKDFITGNLVNWTLSNSVTRTHIVVRVAYGTDTVHARALMQQLAEACEFVLKDPPPFTVFRSFGDNSLELRLYVYLPRMDVLWDATNELMTGIDEAFKAAGISIAFPQRDLHLDTSTPLEFRLLPPTPARES